MLNAHNTIRQDNLAERIADTTRWKPHRLELSLVVEQLIEDLGWMGFIEGGTLLGAWRSGEMLPHDDDFDYALLFPDLGVAECDSVLPLLCTKASRWLKQHWPRAECRVVHTYAKKLEIYYPEFGAYPFRDGDYHNVCCDLTLYLQHPELPDCYQQQHQLTRHLPVPKGAVLPLGLIEYEGHRYRAPNDPKTFLAALYGYLGLDAVFNPSTGLYEPRAEAHVESLYQLFQKHFPEWCAHSVSAIALPRPLPDSVRLHPALEDVLPQGDDFSDKLQGYCRDHERLQRQFTEAVGEAEQRIAELALGELRLRVIELFSQEFASPALVQRIVRDHHLERDIDDELQHLEQENQQLEQTIASMQRQRQDNHHKLTALRALCF